MTGHLTGPAEAVSRRIGTNGAGISYDTFLDLRFRDASKRFLFRIFDTDGPSAEPIVAIIGGIDGIPLPTSWRADQDGGRASLAQDGSSARFDLQFRANLGVNADVAGSISGPTLP